MTGDDVPDRFIDHRLDRQPALKPGNAVAAIVTVEGRYLLQLRDNSAGIFFPGGWGCWGGGVEAGESLTEALARELREELDLVAGSDELRYFTRFDFYLAFAQRPPIWRYFYELELSPDRLSSLRVLEGAAMQLFRPDEILAAKEALTPYDAFALWLHIDRERLVG